jgi:hypothetical protein
MIDTKIFKKSHSETGVFIQVGVYHSRSKRKNTKFKVVYGVTLDEVRASLDDAVAKLVNDKIRRGDLGGRL